ncbi:MAG TPA: CoA-transferase [Candidatus Methylomirabilis sp.]|nr:CoA-transferase [Candidatus Methylomirabilis sp.]HSC71196.1 CoA-transferase [Candidatus Methylomirabilis sp.]
MEYAKDYTPNELLVVTAARELRDGELGFVGVGTAGRAFTLAVGIPIAAARLAQMTHAPNFEIYWGNLLSPDLTRIPPRLTQHHVTTWPCAAQLANTGDKCDMLARRQFDVCFDSAPQIDRFGNLNITAIGEYRHPKARLIGCLAQPDHFAFVNRPIVVTDLRPRTFVERVDFITSVGHLEGKDSRIKAGLAPGGPWRVITDKAVFDFHSETREMQVHSVHPGVTLDEVLASMSFRPAIPKEVPATEPPTTDHVRLIRQAIDPNHILLVA